MIADTHNGVGRNNTQRCTFGFQLGSGACELSKPTLCGVQVARSCMVVDTHLGVPFGVKKVNIVWACGQGTKLVR